MVFPGCGWRPSAWPAGVGLADGSGDFDSNATHADKGFVEVLDGRLGIFGCLVPNIADATVGEQPRVGHLAPSRREMLLEVRLRDGWRQALDEYARGLHLVKLV